MGLNPSDGSSSIISLGFASMARLIASICCSPPDKNGGRHVPTFGKVRETVVDCLGFSRHIVGPAIGTHQEVFMYGQADEYLASFGDQYQSRPDAAGG